MEKNCSIFKQPQGRERRCFWIWRNVPMQSQDFAVTVPTTKITVTGLVVEISRELTAHVQLRLMSVQLWMRERTTTYQLLWLQHWQVYKFMCFGLVVLQNFVYTWCNLSVAVPTIHLFLSLSSCVAKHHFSWWLSERESRCMADCAKLWSRTPSRPLV